MRFYDGPDGEGRSELAGPLRQLNKALLNIHSAAPEQNPLLNKAAMDLSTEEGTKRIAVGAIDLKFDFSGEENRRQAVETVTGCPK